MDTLTLKSLQLSGHHGVHEEERKKGNRFEVDVIVRGEFRQAGRSDDLTLVPDYELIAEVAEEVVTGPSRQLIETLCLEIGEKILEKIPGIDSLEVAVRKLTPPVKQPAAWAETRMKWPK